jgi:predicted transcriptional regulator
MESSTRRLQVDRFVLIEIDSVPHLEALLLLFNSRPSPWSIEEIAKSLYVRQEVAARILEGLVQRNLIAAVRASGMFFYNPDDEKRNSLIEDVDAVYRKEVVRISSMIHSKAPAGLRDFARAFRFKKDKE